jgi:quinol monooxygenase YgiN
MVVVTFKLHGKSGNQLEINQSLVGIADKLKKLDGCKDSKVYQDVEDESIFFMV